MLNPSTTQETQPTTAPIRPVDQLVLDLLRREEGLSVLDLMERLEVTATAIRQRLDRLEEAGYIERRKHQTGRGRPSFNYFLTDKGKRQAGVTYSDMAITMWKEIQSLEPSELKNQLIERISERMGVAMRERMPDVPLEERMQWMAGVLTNNRVPSCMTTGYGLPVLEVQACPYPDLVSCSSDRSVCDLEKKVFSHALGQDMELSQCRLDGHACCQFKPTHPIANAMSVGQSSLTTTN